MVEHDQDDRWLTEETFQSEGFEGMDLIRQIRDTAGASSFIQKPASYSDTIFKVRSFINYWFRTVELPV